jgi:hypothetical protein
VKIKLIKYFGIPVIIGTAIFHSWTIWARYHYHFDAIERNIPDVVLLRSNINNYMERQVSVNTRGKDDYHCACELLGYDNKYAYAVVECQGYIRSDFYESILGSASVGPIRFEIQKSSFQIVNSESPGNDIAFERELKKLFPRVIFNKYFESVENANSRSYSLEHEIKIKAGILPDSI